MIVLSSTVTRVMLHLKHGKRANCARYIHLHSGTCTVRPYEPVLGMEGLESDVSGLVL